MRFQESSGGLAQHPYRKHSPRTHRLPVAVTVLVLACGGESPEATHGLRDDAGRSVALAAPAERIVSLAPATTELLFAIGAGERVVGRTRWAAYPPAALDVPSIGDGLNPNIEVVAARQPDLVVMYATEANAQAIARFDALGIPTVSVAMDRVESVAQAARLLGRLTGRAAVADSMATAFERELATRRRTVGSDPGPGIVILNWENPPIVIAGGSFLSQFVRLAGAHNLFDDIDEPSATVTIEIVASRDPELLLFIGRDNVSNVTGRPEWQVVEAVRDRRLVWLDGSDFSWPSFRAFEAIDRLRSALAETR